MTTYWCALAWLGGPRPEEGVTVEVEGGRIASVEREATPRRDARRLSGLTLPGLANAHSHAFQRALRGRTQGGSGSFWTWREQMYALAERLDPDVYLDVARATYSEMALAPASRPSGSSTTCITARAARPTRTRTRWGVPSSQPPLTPASGSR